ncbi:hypothetical protein I8J29_27390 [Paenibacillus sp. MWE-103]|uniref:DUF5659 domain-containing protein n=1 Tax=Paenibacillus artemisiicola TaxID=1172618 RepID=A0ABS3WHW9_9BACL|nr:DUF5659 domain-containing protein [Paenibacillus artemisiicola]MBO7747921.1 hypothetical protein [Paenibacillus artemisiicola]
MKQTYIVYYLPLANYLLSKHFRLVNVAKNKYVSDKLVFFFENTLELQFEVNEYKNNSSA